MWSVITVQNNTPLPHMFGTKSEALDYYDAQVSGGMVYVTLWEICEGFFNYLDPEAVRRNLKTEGVWL